MNGGLRSLVQPSTDSLICECIKCCAAQHRLDSLLSSLLIPAPHFGSRILQGPRSLARATTSLKENDFNILFPPICHAQCGQRYLVRISFDS